MGVSICVAMSLHLLAHIVTRDRKMTTKSGMLTGRSRRSATRMRMITTWWRGNYRTLFPGQGGQHGRKRQRSSSCSSSAPLNVVLKKGARHLTRLPWSRVVDAVNEDCFLDLFRAVALLNKDTGTSALHAFVLVNNIGAWTLPGIAVSNMIYIAGCIACNASAMGGHSRLPVPHPPFIPHPSCPPRIPC
jgi:hypothetical protein